MPVILCSADLKPEGTLQTEDGQQLQTILCCRNLGQVQRWLMMTKVQTAVLMPQSHISFTIDIISCPSHQASILMLCQAYQYVLGCSDELLNACCQTCTSEGEILMQSFWFSDIFCSFAAAAEAACLA